MRRALRHQEHVALVRQFTLEELFAGSESQVFQLFSKFAEMMQACGPVTMIPQKPRVVFQVRVRYGGCYPRKSHLQVALALARVDDDPRFFKIEKYAPDFIGHHFRVHSEADLNRDDQRWMCESYEVGAQKHLKSKRR